MIWIFLLFFLLCRSFSLSCRRKPIDSQLSVDSSIFCFLNPESRRKGDEILKYDKSDHCFPFSATKSDHCFPFLRLWHSNRHASRSVRGEPPISRWSRFFFNRRRSNFHIRSRSPKRTPFDWSSVASVPAPPRYYTARSTSDSIIIWSRG